MAKKKRRYGKKRKHKTRGPKGNDMHHLLWYRRKWDKSPARKLRHHPYCIVSIPQNTLHQQIHQRVEQIPVPSAESVERVLFHLSLLETYGGIKAKDSIEKRLKVLIALFDCSEQKTADALRKQLQVVREFNEPS